MALCTMSSRILQRTIAAFSVQSRVFLSGGEWGSGSGKGGGAGGSVREAGGSFGKLQAAREEEYFRKLQIQQLAELRKHVDDEISYHKKLIQQHKEAIERLEGRMDDLKPTVAEMMTKDENEKKKDEEEKEKDPQK